MCGPMVVCGKCGNNCCNGSYGKLSGSKMCDACPSAYEMQAAGMTDSFDFLKHNAKGGE